MVSQQCPSMSLPFGLAFTSSSINTTAVNGNITNGSGSNGSNGSNASSLPMDDWQLIPRSLTLVIQSMWQQQTDMIATITSLTERLLKAEQVASAANTQAAAAATMASTIVSRPGTSNGPNSGTMTTGVASAPTATSSSSVATVPVLVALTAASVAAANPQDGISSSISSHNYDDVITMISSLRAQLSETTTVHSNKIISLESDLQLAREEFGTRASLIENNQRTQGEHLSRQCEKHAKESKDLCKQNGRMTEKLLVVVSDQQKRTERVSSQMDFLQRYTLENQPPGDRAMSDPLSLFNRLISLSTTAAPPLPVPSLPYAHPLPPQAHSSLLSSPHHLRSRTSPSASTLTSPMPVAGLVITTNGPHRTTPQPPRSRRGSISVRTDDDDTTTGATAMTTTTAAAPLTAGGAPMTATNTWSTTTPGRSRFPVDASVIAIQNSLKEVADTYRGTIQIEVTGLRSSLETLRKNSQEELARQARIVRDFTHEHHIHVQNLRAQMVATQDTVAQRMEETLERLAASERRLGDVDGNAKRRHDMITDEFKRINEQTSSTLATLEHRLTMSLTGPVTPNTTHATWDNHIIQLQHRVSEVEKIINATTSHNGVAVSKLQYKLDGNNRVIQSKFDQMATELRALVLDTISSLPSVANGGSGRVVRQWPRRQRDTIHDEKDIHPLRVDGPQVTANGNGNGATTTSITANPFPSSSVSSSSVTRGIAKRMTSRQHRLSSSILTNHVQQKFGLSLTPQRHFATNVPSSTATSATPPTAVTTAAAATTVGISSQANTSSNTNTTGASTSVASSPRGSHTPVPVPFPSSPATTIAASAATILPSINGGGGTPRVSSADNPSLS